MKVLGWLLFSGIPKCDQVVWGEHEGRRSPNRGQAGREELIQRIRCGDARSQGGGIGGAAQARIPAEPADHLIQARSGGAREAARRLGVTTDGGSRCAHGLG